MSKKLALVVYGKPGREYLIDLSSAMATRLSEREFEQVKQANPDKFEGYRYIKPCDIDFSWWYRVHRYLTKSKITSREFDIDYYGNVTEY